VHLGACKSRAPPCGRVEGTYVTLLSFLLLLLASCLPEGGTWGTVLVLGELLGSVRFADGRPGPPRFRYYKQDAAAGSGSPVSCAGRADEEDDHLVMSYAVLLEAQPVQGGGGGHSLHQEGADQQAQQRLQPQGGWVGGWHRGARACMRAGPVHCVPPSLGVAPPPMPL